jgi:hypothetical protein
MSHVLENAAVAAIPPHTTHSWSTRIWQEGCKVYYIFAAPQTDAGAIDRRKYPRGAVTALT